MTNSRGERLRVVKSAIEILRLESRSPSFPESLLAIEGPPEQLWARGRIELAKGRGPKVAIVGTRAPTPYGQVQAARFGAALARAGVVVVSGLARGVDQAAHRATLEAGGDTIAVLGSGLERPWPDVPLVEEIARGGLLLSEFEPQMSPRPHHFPLRNRIISGLADAVLVIEAAAASGSLITAQWALDQGREIFALPGRVDQPMSAGCHKLLREGARLVESPGELLEELYGARLIAPSTADSLDPSGTASDPVGPERSPLEQCLLGESLTVDELAERLRQPLASVLVEVVELEVQGRLIRAPGGLFQLR